MFMSISYIIADCLNESNGLTVLRKQIQEGTSDRFTLGFTDPPFNINLPKNVNAGKTFQSTRIKQNLNQSYYNDIFHEEEQYNDIEYKQWCKTWFQYLYDICDIVIIYCGNINKFMWYSIEPPLDEFIYYTPFNYIITPISWVGRYKPLLVYTHDKNLFLGRNGTYKLHTNVIVKPRTEIIQKNYQKKLNPYCHPCPLDEYLVYRVLRELKPKSVIDPFLGSGTILSACKQLHIPCCGFEKNPIYESDIKKRLRQQNLQFLLK